MTQQIQKGLGWVNLKIVNVDLEKLLALNSLSMNIFVACNVLENAWEKFE